MQSRDLQNKFHSRVFSLSHPSISVSLEFKRKGDDLFAEHTLSLTEALCGFQFILTHLDGRQLLIKKNPGEVVKPGQFKAINDEGMPFTSGTT